MSMKEIQLETADNYDKFTDGDNDEDNDGHDDTDHQVGSPVKNPPPACRLPQ
jgi:hypothetical protein